LIIAIATLVLIGYPSAPSLADSSNAISAKKGNSGTVVVSSGGTAVGGNSEGGGSNEGDADGLSGFKGRPPVSTVNSASGVTRVLIELQNWWKFMLWSR
jgi:hypothetical protein